MSLSRALAELFKAVREEAARNEIFAARLEEALQLYKPSRRRRQAKPVHPVEPEKTPGAREALEAFDPEPQAPGEPPARSPALNPIALFSQDGEAALRSALEADIYSAEALGELIAEHNLDPAGEAAAGDRMALVEQIVAQARKRVERDRKLFDY